VVMEGATVGVVVTGHGQWVLVTNEVGGVWEMGAGARWEQRNTGFSATLGIYNEGLLRSASLGTNHIASVPLHNGGELEVLNGVLHQNGGGISPGVFRIAAGCQHDFWGGTYDLTGSRWFGPGAAAIVGHATLAGAFEAENFLLAGGNLSGTFQITGGFRWRSGWLAGAQARLGPGTHRIEGPDEKALNHAVLTNSGVLVVDGAALGFTVTGHGQACVLTNEPSGRIDLAGSATVQQRNAGYPAVLAMRNGGVLRKVGSGTATISGIPLANNATCEIVEGALQVQSLTLDASAQVVVPASIDAPLRVVGAVDLAGVLGARTTAGQVVTNGQQFEALEAGAINGTFANTLAENPGHLFGYNVGYTPQTVTLTAELVAENPVTLTEIKAENGKFTIKLNGAVNLLYLIEVSTNLIHWAPLLITNAPAGTVSLEDPALALDPQRFYRLGLFP